LTSAGIKPNHMEVFQERKIQMGGTHKGGEFSGSPHTTRQIKKNSLGPQKTTGSQGGEKKKKQVQPLGKTKAQKVDVRGKKN